MLCTHLRGTASSQHSYNTSSVQYFELIMSINKHIVRVLTCKQYDELAGGGIK